MWKKCALSLGGKELELMDGDSEAGEPIGEWNEKSMKENDYDEADGMKQQD